MTLRVSHEGRDEASRHSEPHYEGAQLSYGENPFEFNTRHVDPYGGPAEAVAVPEQRKSALKQISRHPSAMKPQAQARQRYLTDPEYGLWEHDRDNAWSETMPMSSEVAYRDETAFRRPPGKLMVGAAAAAPKPFSGVQAARATARPADMISANRPAAPPGRKAVTILDAPPKSMTRNVAPISRPISAAYGARGPHVTHPFSSRAAPPDSPFVSLPPSPSASSEGYPRVSSNGSHQWEDPHLELQVHPFASKEHRAPASENPLHSPRMRPHSYAYENPFAAPPSLGQQVDSYNNGRYGEDSRQVERGTQHQHYEERPVERGHTWIRQGNGDQSGPDGNLRAAYLAR